MTPRFDEARRAWLAGTTASPAAAARIRGRLRRGDRRGRQVLGAVLVTAVVVLAVLAGRPDPSSFYALTLDGEGRVGGTEREPVVEWEAGTLTVRVVPDRGVHLGVRTPEALVEVVGTAFTVERSLHATDVRVTEGHVRVTCVGTAAAVFGPGEHARCLPADAPTLLLRAAELAGGDAAERVDDATRGLAAPDAAGAVRAELLAHRSDALAELGRVDEALTDAGAYLATGEAARRPEMLDFVARTRFAREGCAARDALEAAVVAVPDGAPALLVATCVADADPVRAAALVRAAAPGARGEWSVLAERLADRLGIER